LIEQNIPLL